MYVAYLVDELSTRRALHAKRRHEAHWLDLGAGLLRASLPNEGARIEVWRVVFPEDLAFRHGCGLAPSYCVLQRRKRVDGRILSMHKFGGEVAQIPSLSRKTKKPGDKAIRL